MSVPIARAKLPRKAPERLHFAIVMKIAAKEERHQRTRYGFFMVRRTPRIPAAMPHLMTRNRILNATVPMGQSITTPRITVIREKISQYRRTPVAFIVCQAFLQPFCRLQVCHHQGLRSVRTDPNPSPPSVRFPMQRPPGHRRSRH